jgi:hypothetical protein
MAIAVEILHERHFETIIPAQSPLLKKHCKAVLLWRKRSATDIKGHGRKHEHID